MKLSELKTGEQGVVVRVNGHGSFRKRILEMGFIRGNLVKVVLNAPMKDPIEYEIIGYKITLRREEAEMIEIISESEAKEMPCGQIIPNVIEAEKCDDILMLHTKMKTLAEQRRRKIRVALVGNPNCGKTSLFNMASGGHEHVGNYSGVTVDAKEGYFSHGGYEFILVDLPGTYSISGFSPEELYVRKNLIEETPDVVINVLDSSNLERNLYLTTQLIDMNIRMVAALNMFDELKERKAGLDIRTLGHLLGMPMIPTVSRTGEGIGELFDTVIQVFENSDPKIARHIHINHGTELEQCIDRIKILIQKNHDIRYKYSTRYLAIKYLENDKEVTGIVENLPNRDEIIAARYEEQKRFEALMGGVSTESAIVDAKYAFVKGALKETYTPGIQVKKHRSLTDRIDMVVTDRWLAFPIFILMLFLVFQGTFSLGEYPMQWIEWIIGKFGDFVSLTMRDGALKSLVVDGIIGGVGSVLVFLPNILLLYLFISLLEDSGYMARAAFIMDRMMHKMGLHGKSFIPMIMGFGCNVPAVMATRTIESRKSRLITIMIIPLMSCAGRLPVYLLIVSAFFPKWGGLVMLGLYGLGILLAILSAKVMSRFMKDDDLPFVMELPPYRIPTSKSVLRHTWEKGKQYLQKMSGIILVFSVVIWFLGYYPNHDAYGSVAEQQENSYIGHIGKAIEPVLAPLGYDWRMGVGILSGIGAKELVVSTMGVMFSGSDVASAAGSGSAAGPGSASGSGSVSGGVGDVAGSDVGAVAGSGSASSPGSVSGGVGDVADSDVGAAAGPGSALSSGSVLGGVGDVADGAVAGSVSGAGASDIVQAQAVHETGSTALQKALVATITPAAALSFVVFILLYFPCVATFVAIKQEAGGWKPALLSAVFTIVLAWLVAYVVFRIASLFL